jgi:CopG family transcriptional regulator / antitoxin EndoAI
MSKRINIVLSDRTIRRLDRAAKPGERSRFVDAAVCHYIDHQSTEALRTRLESAATRDRDLDREIAEDWFAVDQEEWKKFDESSRGAAKSTSRRSIRR